MIQDDSTLKWYLYGDVSERERDRDRERKTERDRAREKVNITRDNIS